MRTAFRMPLAKQTRAVLVELRKITGDSKFLFPSRTRGRSVYPNRLNIALRKLGYDADQVSAHGFRSTASTILHEAGKFSIDAIEASLAHRPRGVRAIYNRSTYWTERCELVQWYADHLDSLRDRGKVVAMPRKTGRRKS